jgi:HK97 family phage prohead protease
MSGDPESSGFIRERYFSGGDLEIRGDGRTVFGLAVPFDQVARVSDGGPSYRERFVRGAFARTLSGNAGSRVKLMANHDRKRFPVGRATALREDSAGLVGEFHVSATRDGDEVLQLIRDKVLDSFSVGFSPVRHRRSDDGVTERLEVALREVSIVAFPAYEGALIGGVRDLDDLDDDDEWLVSASARRRRLTLARSKVVI